MSKLILLSGEQNHRCCYCGHIMVKSRSDDGYRHPKNAMTRDHVVPASYGGINKYHNIVIACSQCNNLRGNLDAFVFFYLVRKWFRQDFYLQSRWHSVSKPELRRFKFEVLYYHEFHLRRKGMQRIEYAFRHREFLRHHSKDIRRPHPVMIAAFA